MISSASEEATRAGLAILRDGGNAVDAAVAVGFALAVTLPQAGNLGGGGFMVIRMADGRTTTLDFRETAPGAATRDMFLDSAGNFVPSRSQLGALAAGVPGSPAGLLMALEKYGTKNRHDILQPAIKLAEQGFPLHERLNEDLTGKLNDFAHFPGTLKVFAPDSHPPPPGTIFRPPDLAATLRRISDSGASGFYTGPTADLIVAEMKRSGGIITHDDLRNYRPTERKPVTGSYRGYEIISMPPPSSGGVLLIQMLNMMERYNFTESGFHSAQHAHLIAEIMRRAYADRAEFLGDPDHFDVPVAGLTSRDYARSRAATITDSATPSASVGHGDTARFKNESTQTTHYSVVDREGNCVSVTTTLNSSFGSKLVVDGAGFLLNNEMDDFSAKPNAPNLYGLVGNEANAIAPGKRMLSSMTPTIVTYKGAPWLIVGTPGGSTIITTVLQVIQNQIDFHMNLVDAIESPRIHHQWLPDTIFYEKGSFAQSAIDSLRKMGYRIVEREEPSGRVDAISISEEEGERVYYGWSDLRGYGLAAGVQDREP
jgi:gamma-glutamyltranspeptidase/glutathione hydrolase